MTTAAISKNLRDGTWLEATIKADVARARLRDDLLLMKMGGAGTTIELICLTCEHEFWAPVRSGAPDTCPLCGGARLALTGEVREA